MNRRDWVKSLAAIAIASQIPVREVAAHAQMALGIQIGSIFQMYGKELASGYITTVHVIKTDSGFERLEGGFLSKERFPKLFEVIGNSYGGEEGRFRLPDLRANVQNHNL